MKLLTITLTVLTLTGCMRLPPEVAAELSAPDGLRPNHFAPVDETRPATDTAPAQSP